MRSKLIKITALCLLTASVFATSAAATTLGGGTVNATALYLRSEQSTASTAKTLIPGGAFLLVEEQVGDWYKVLYNGTEGYAHSDFVAYSQTLDGNYGIKGVISGDGVRMRSGPSRNDAILANPGRGTQLDIIGISGAWLKVKTDSGTVGYVHSDYIDCTSTGSASATPSYTIGEQIVATAKEYLGYRYVWGGMSTSGFDCSGFVNYVYKLYGYTMNRVAQSIYSNDGTSVDKSSLAAGDLIFFGYSGSSVSHVGMYIGNGQFIHASSSAGQVVITDLSESYYTRMYVGAKRIA